MNQNTKQRLIETATHLIWQSSYGAVSVDEICKNADAKKGSFYHYFSSKAELAIASMEAHFEEFKPLFDEAFSPEIPPLERLSNLVRLAVHKQEEALKQYGKVCGCPFVTLGSEMAGQEEEIQAKVKEVLERYTENLSSTLKDLLDEGLISADTNIETKSQELHCYIMGQVMMARIMNSLEPIKRDLLGGLHRILEIRDIEQEIQNA